MLRRLTFLKVRKKEIDGDIPHMISQIPGPSVIDYYLLIDAPENYLITWDKRAISIGMERLT